MSGVDASAVVTVADVQKVINASLKGQTWADILPAALSAPAPVLAVANGSPAGVVSKTAFGIPLWMLAVAVAGFFIYEGNK